MNKKTIYKATRKKKDAADDWKPISIPDEVAEVRTNIVMEEPLVYEAQSITGIKTKTGVVHYALRELVRRDRMKDALRMRGKVGFWDGYIAEHVKP